MAAGLSGCPGEVHALPVILYLEPDGPLQSPGNVEEPLDDQSPFFLWGPTRSASPLRAAALRDHWPPSHPPQKSAPTHGTPLCTQAPRCSLSSLGSRLPLGEGPHISLCSKARGPGWRGSLRRALPPLGSRGWDRALSQVSHRNAAAVRQARPHSGKENVPGKHSCADTGATWASSPPSACPAQGAHGHLLLLGMCQGHWIPCPLELSRTSMVPTPDFQAGLSPEGQSCLPHHLGYGQSCAPLMAHTLRVSATAPSRHP